MKKFNLTAIAAALLIGGVTGGTLGTAATGVVSYTAHADALKTLAADSAQLDAAVHADRPDPEAIQAAAEAVNQDVAGAVDSFQSLDTSAKKAWKDIGGR